MMLDREIEFSGSDYFLCAMDRIARSGGRPGSQCRMIIELDGKLDPEDFCAAVNRSPWLQWLVNVRMVRKLPFTLPRWRSNGAGNPVPVACLAAEEGRSGKKGNVVSFPRHSGPDAIPPPLSFTLANHDNAGSICILNWDHTLMDAAGAELLIQHVARWPETPGRLSSLLPADKQNIDSRVPRSLGFPGRFSYARRSVRYISETSEMPIAVMNPSGSVQESSDQYFAIRFDDEETRAIVAQCERIGLSYYHSLFYLAAATRAVHAVRMRRMGETAAYLVPVPLNLRRKGGHGPVFSNNVSFLFYRLTPEVIADFQATVVSLKKQMKEQIMQEIPHSYAELMKILRRLPLPFYSRLLSGPTRGQLASFFFSCTGECCTGMNSFMGQPVREVTHLAPATSTPGLSIVFMRHRNCLKMILSFRDSLFTQEDLQLFEERLRLDLLPEKW